MNTFNLPNAASMTVYQDAGALATAVAHRIADIIRKVSAEQGVCRIALAGGGTPRLCYEKLSKLPLDWSQVHIYFGDERCLPAGDAERNDTMAHHALLQHVAIPAAHIHSIPAEQGAQAAASRYALQLEPMLPLDLVLLGMGEDGHTASLFPGNAALAGVESVVAVFDAPKPPSERVSLGAATLNSARHKLFIVAGAGKRDALQEIKQGGQLPAGNVMEAEWYLDQDALPSEKI